ncbi:MAG: hypothetical protein R3C15_13775 [Thermoleophilia bacterium]
MRTRVHGEGVGLGRILIGEPHREVREVLGSLVAGLGHEAVHAPGADLPGGADDLVAAIVDPADPDALDLARALRVARPDLPIVGASGHGPSAETRSLAPDAHLLKPFPLDDLATALTAAVARARSRSA